MAEQNQLNKDQVMEIIKKVVVSVDVNENAIIMSTKKLLSHFLSNTQELDRIIKVDVNDDKEIIVYASAKPTNPDIKSVILKVTLKSGALRINNLKYELIKAEDDVYIKIYVEQYQEQTASNVNVNDEVDF